MFRSVTLFCVLLALTSAFLCPTSAAETARGFVFEDRDGNGVHNAGEPGIAGVVVSNGRNVVRTGDDGAYLLSVEDGDIIFVTKPRGWAVPVDESNLPRFHYVHSPGGTPASLGLRYSGIAPTGPLPPSVDFPLTRAADPDTFRVVWFADPQPQIGAEVDFIRDDVVADLIGTDALCGITVGDIMYDDLALLPRYNTIVGTIGIPWYNAPGNHDLNYLSPDDDSSLETFKRIYGPPDYSFDHGRAHFIVLDTVFYLGNNVGRDEPELRGQGRYEGRLTERQLEWLANDLALVPKENLVVFAMHIPLREPLAPDRERVNVTNREELFRLLEDRPHLFAVAGHMHAVSHDYFDEDDGLDAPAPMHQHIIATVSGSWWSGPYDARGIPFADQRDGTPNGYYVMTVSGTDVEMDFHAAGGAANHQMRVMLDTIFHLDDEGSFRVTRPGQLLGSPLDRDQLPATQILVSLFDGGPRSTVVATVGARPAVPLERVVRKDPYIEELFKRYPETIKWFVKVVSSQHLWTAPLPADLEPGAHTLMVHATDEYGRTHVAYKVIEVR